MEKQQWRVGDCTITKVVELESIGRATWILPDATKEALLRVPWCQPHFVRPDGKAVVSVHSLLVESQGQRIVVDTCIGNRKNLPSVKLWHQRSGGTFLADLTAAGFAPDSVDTVLCTHLHVDHVGWNTQQQNGRWLPTFANARYLWNREEYEHWAQTGQQEYGDVISESVQPVVDAGLMDFVTGAHIITDEIQLEPTPGHTPGHCSVHINSRGEEAVITGDIMHHPAQITNPHWHSSADWNGAMAEQTRREFLQRYADRPVLIIGTHFATPTAGRLVRDGAQYRLDC